MQEGQRVRDIHEPGHRYLPRAPRSRLVRDVVVGRRFTTPARSQPLTDTPQAPVTSQWSSPPSMKPAKSLAIQDVAAKSAARTKDIKPALPRQNRSIVLRRKISDRAIKHKKTMRAERRRTVIAFVFGSLAASAIVGGAFLLYVANGHNRQPNTAKNPIATLGIATEKQVEETPVSTQEMADYKVAASQPRVIRIPKLGIEARIKPVQQAYGGEPVITPNIYDAGWLETSALPGTNGVAVINGAKAGPTKVGIFNTLSNLSVGDEIQIEMGNGKQIKYSVVGSEQFEANEVNMDVVRKPAIAGAGGLNLLTNTGRFNVKTNRFESRTLITAVIRN